MSVPSVIEKMHIILEVPDILHQESSTADLVAICEEQRNKLANAKKASNDYLVLVTKQEKELVDEVDQLKMVLRTKEHELDDHRRRYSGPARIKDDFNKRQIEEKEAQIVLLREIDDPEKPKILSPQGGASLFMLKYVMGTQHRAALLEYIQQITGGAGLAGPIRALHKLLDRLGLGECEEWIALSNSPPFGYTIQEWRSKWPNPRNPPVVNDEWPTAESFDRLCDKFGLGKELPSPRISAADVSRKCHFKFDDEEEEDELRSQAATILDDLASKGKLKAFVALFSTTSLT